MIALILTRWRLVAGGAAVLLVTILLLDLQHERHARAEAERRREYAVAEAAAAQAQAKLNEASAAVAAEAGARAALVTGKGQEAVHAILSTPGADVRLPDPVRAGWLAGVVGVRQSASDVTAISDHPGG